MTNVTKQGRAEERAGLDDQALTAINRLSRGTLTQEDVYTFGVRLCDNQTDRDQEYFDRQGLERLAELFVGKTGLFDHSWSARDQTARIYRTEIVEEPGMVTEAGEPGCYLKGYAYMLRTRENEALIAEIEGGIKKEVSVSCAVNRCVCSICGNDIQDRGLCSHVKGRIYEGKRCIVRLAGPTDAFEWSFVAVPAQPMAGVVKGFQEGALRRALAGTGPEEDWREELRQLEQQAEIGRRYLEDLRRETVRLGLLAEASLSGDTLRVITDKPLGMNIMLLSPNADDLAQLAIDEKIEVLTTGAGNPGKYIADWKNAGIKVMPVVASVALAKRMERAGADAVIAEGMEGGGHIGELTTMPLVPQVVDALSIPVIAAGGIADGRGMAAAMMLGAEGVQCGTIFLATPECQISEKYKELVLKATDISTVVTGRPSGHPVRSLKTPMARKCLELEKQNTDASLEELEKATAGSLRKAVQDGNYEEGTFMSGQIAGMLKELHPCEEILKGMTAQAEDLLKNAYKRFE